MTSVIGLFSWWDMWEISWFSWRQVLDDLVKSLRLDCPAPRTAPRLLDKQPDVWIISMTALSGPFLSLKVFSNNREWWWHQNINRYCTISEALRPFPWGQHCQPHLHNWASSGTVAGWMDGVWVGRTFSRILLGHESIGQMASQQGRSYRAIWALCHGQGLGKPAWGCSIMTSEEAVLSWKSLRPRRETPRPMRPSMQE